MEIEKILSINAPTQEDMLGMIISNQIDYGHTENGGMVSVKRFQTLAEHIIKWHECEVKKLKQADVSNRREQLIAFAKFVEDVYWDNKGIEDAVDTFIKTKGN